MPPTTGSPTTPRRTTSSSRGIFRWRPAAWTTGRGCLGHKGRAFTEDNIGDALASRHLLTMLREQGEMTKGPPPFTPKDRSKFLQRLDQTINEIKRDNS